MSACTVGMLCQQPHHRPVSRHISKVGPTGHIISREPSRVEPSRFEAEPSREPRDKILCSRVYVQPDLRLNLGRSSGQNCFDQILAVWNTIWTISDLFPANLIIPDAMVRSDRWDLRPKRRWWINKRDCPIRRHPKVIMVVDGDEEEEGAHVYPITCVELLSGEIWIALREGKIGTLWTPDHVDNLRWRVEIDEDQSWRI
jgi:hypothetical protein